MILSLVLYNLESDLVLGFNLNISEIFVEFSNSLPYSISIKTYS